MSKASRLKSDINVYNCDVELNTNITALFKTNNNISKICYEYINYMKEDTFKFKRRETVYYFVNKMEKAVKKQRYKMSKSKSYYKSVYINKTRFLIEDGHKTKCEFIEEKEIKQYIFDSLQLIEFIMMLRCTHKIVSDFVKVPDVIFIIRQLELLGIEEIVKQLEQYEL